ncbi:MAG: redoxin domain-containing protein [Acidobacteriota bacterium]|nr:redoxin domain-containing protein [Acidobacteriota bacterium]
MGESGVVLLLLGALMGMGMDGRPVDPFKADITVLVFVRTDCPISNRYAPEIQRISSEFSAKNVRFWMVYPDASESPEHIRKHVAEYGFPGEPLRDPKKELVKLAQVRVTPEVAIFAAGAKLVYHGRIDDRVAGFGKSRAQASTHDLETALAAIAAGRPVPREKTSAVGCYISDLP